MTVDSEGQDICYANDRAMELPIIILIQRQTMQRKYIEIRTDQIDIEKKYKFKYTEPMNEFFLRRTNKR